MPHSISFYQDHQHPRMLLKLVANSRSHISWPAISIWDNEVFLLWKHFIHLASRISHCPTFPPPSLATPSSSHLVVFPQVPLSKCCSSLECGFCASSSFILSSSLTNTLTFPNLYVQPSPLPELQASLVYLTFSISVWMSNRHASQLTSVIKLLILSLNPSSL